MDFNRELTNYLFPQALFFQTDPISNTLLAQWGAPGAIVLALGATIIWLFRYYTGRIKEKDEEIARLNTAIADQAREANAAIAEQAREANAKMVELIKQAVETSNKSTDSIRVIAGSVDDLTNSMQLNEKILRLIVKNEES